MSDILQLSAYYALPELILVIGAMALLMGRRDGRRIID